MREIAIESKTCPKKLRGRFINCRRWGRVYDFGEASGEAAGEAAAFDFFAFFSPVLIGPIFTIFASRLPSAAFQ